MSVAGRKSKGNLVVVKLSGSLFFSDDLSRVADSLKTVLNKDKTLKLILVAGGGGMARQYIHAAGKFGEDQATLDEIGIGASRLNAKVTISALGDIALDQVPATLRELVHAHELAGSNKRVIVVGGLHPGQSTNAVAALVAERLHARLFVNATSVDGVYTKNPEKFKDAKMLETVNVKELSNILAEESVVAGGYDLMDPVALKLIQRSKVPTIIMKCEGKLLSDVLLDRTSHGTKLVFGKQDG